MLSVHGVETDELDTLGSGFGPEGLVQVVQAQIAYVGAQDQARSIPPLDGSLHVGVVPHIRTLPAIEYHQLYDELSYLYCSSDHPLFNARALTADAVFAADMVTSNYVQSSEVRELERRFNDTAKASDREGVAFLILTGSFIGFLPTHYARQWVDGGRLRALMPDHFSYRTDFAAITRQGARPNRILQTFMSSLSGEAQRSQ